MPQPQPAAPPLPLSLPSLPWSRRRVSCAAAATHAPPPSRTQLHCSWCAFARPVTSCGAPWTTQRPCICCRTSRASCAMSWHWVGATLSCRLQGLWQLQVTRDCVARIDENMTVICSGSCVRACARCCSGKTTPDKRHPVWQQPVTCDPQCLFVLGCGAYAPAGEGRGRGGRFQVILLIALQLHPWMKSCPSLIISRTAFRCASCFGVTSSLSSSWLLFVVISTATITATILFLHRHH